MNNHPITNLPMLDERNYRSWEPMVRRQFEARDLVMFIDYTNPTTGLDVPRHAMAVNLINEHVSEDIRLEYFNFNDSAFELWAILYNKFGPSNTLLGEAGKHLLLSNHWKVGDDPAKFIRKINYIVGDIRYYGGVFPDATLISAFFTLLPMNHPDWEGFQRSLNVLPNLTWSDLQVIFIKTALQSNSNDRKTTTSGSVMAASIASNPHVHIPWAEDQKFHAELKIIAERYQFKICAKCKTYGHLITEHDDKVKSRHTRKNREKSKEDVPKTSASSTPNSGSANYIRAIR